MISTATLPTVALGETAVTMRRLGPLDLGHVATIVRASQEAWTQDQGWRINPTPWRTPQGLVSFLLVGLPRAGDAATPWLGSLIGLSAEDSRDPDKLNLTVLSEIFEGLLAHPDLLNLQAALGRIWSSDALKPVRDKLSPEKVTTDG